MAVSGSNDFEQNEETIIRDALMLVGGLEDNETPTNEQKSYARRALNRMVKAWSVKGLKAWCWNQASIATVDGDEKYTIGPTAPTLVTHRYLEVRNPRVLPSGGDEVPLNVLSRSEYLNLPKPSSEGFPVAIYWDNQLENGDLYVWPTPNASTYFIKLDVKQYIEDFDSATNTPYFPTEWTEAIVYNLAVRLCPRYEVRGEELRILMGQAREYLFDAENGDIEDGSLFIAPMRQY